MVARNKVSSILALGNTVALPSTGIYRQVTYYLALHILVYLALYPSVGGTFLS